MNKKVGIIKRVLCLSLIFLLNINVFAAVVSDNDGSAFITKAEFDSLKNNFQAQIDQYNQSIDAKIDGAIASYLAGIKLDEAKKYKMWGVSAGTWDGKPINRFDIVHISVAITNTGKTFTAGEGNWYAWKPNEHTSAYMDSYALTNRGYGPAYFFNGIVEFNKSNDALIGNSATFFAFDAWNYGLGDSSNYRAVNATIYNPSTNSASYNQGWGINYQNIDTRKEQLKKWCMKGLSDAYNQRINWIDSTVDLVEFLDAGDVAMSFYSVKNGYAEELTTSPYYGMVANEVCTTLQQTQSVVKFVYTKKATGTQTTIMDMKTCADKTWIDWSQTVEAGDKIQFICQTGGGINGTWSNYLNYAFAFFTNQINGWERETT